jgi:hypothetical protein
MREHPSVVWMGFCSLLMAAWMITTACSRMHNWLMGNQSIAADIQRNSLS